MLVKEKIIKVGFCVSYDWELLKNSVPRVYKDAEIICFSLDKNRRSWSGAFYTFDDQKFYNWIKEIDVENKIQVYEDDFFVPELNPLENDNRQRNLMAKFMGEGGWHIQIDSDEYFIDFAAFVNYLKKLNPTPTPKQKPINICVNQIPLLKRLAKGMIVVNFEDRAYEYAPFATNVPIYQAARRNGHFNHISNAFAIHETWARSEQDLWSKINNWGHSEDFNKESYYSLWKALDEYNCQYIKNFHPLQPTTWPSLLYCEGQDIDKVISNLQKKNRFYISEKELSIRNSRNLARLRTLANKLL